MIDAQTKERLEMLGAQVHQLQAKLDKSEAANARMATHVGRLTDENALLRAELDARPAAQMDPAAIMEAAETLLRREGVTSVDLMYWDRGASETTTTLADWHRGRIARGSLAEAFAKFPAVDAAKGEK